MIDSVQFEERMHAYGEVLDSSNSSTAMRRGQRVASIRRPFPTVLVMGSVVVLAFAAALVVRSGEASKSASRMSTPSTSTTDEKVRQLVGGYSSPIDRAVLAMTRGSGTNGIDLQGPQGTPVRSIEKSTFVRILRTQTNNEAGGIELRSLETTYRFTNVQDPGAGLAVGQTIAAGDIVGRVRGAKSVVHLTVEIGGVPIDPFPAIANIASLQLAVEADVIPEGQLTIAQTVGPDLRRLIDAAKQDEIKLGGGGYRSPAAQVRLRKAHCGPTIIDVFVKSPSRCSPPTALPGSSAHERGVAVDFTVNGRAITKGTAAYRWLRKHGVEFHFAQTEPSEPWHWEHQVNPNESR
jgi:hypothetical protein